MAVCQGAEEINDRCPRLGERGQGWVWGQFLLAGVVVLTAALGPRWAGRQPRGSGSRSSWPEAASDCGHCRLSVGPGPYPKPRRAGELVEHGPYRIVRHPIYSSMLVALLGVCLVGSGWALLPWPFLLVWWLGKGTWRRPGCVSTTPATTSTAKGAPPDHPRHFVISSRHGRTG